MIGNDVVDLGDEDSVVKRHHVRFDSRVFAAEELTRLDACRNPEMLRWSMWAAKEAAYKLLKAHCPSVVFVPSRLVVRPAGHNAGTVDAADVRLHVDFQRTSAYVHAIARREPAACSPSRKQVRAPAVTSRAATAATAAAVAAVATHVDGTTHVDDTVSAGEAVRRLAVTSIARMLGEEPSGFSVGSEGRVPMLLRSGRRVPGSLSLSHHGRFVAFAWSPTVICR